MRLQFNAIAQSDLGLVRDGNEDSALISQNLIAVADGMGGHAGGEVASAIAINTLEALLPVITDTSIDIDSREDLFLNLSYEVDAEILRVSKERPELSGMGTTLTALAITSNQVDLLHIGDSRCYLWRDKKLTRLSYDHTVMQELLDQGAVNTR
jgi:PPM family protein phosphatase